MTSDPPNSADQRISPRVPIEAKVNLEFEKFSGFMSQYSTNISEGGMFVKTDDPKPVGTVVSFEFKLRDDFKLIQGLGEVAWVRAVEGGPDKPKGMGIRFHEIDAKSRELIGTMVQQQVRQGRKPFNIDASLGSKPDGAIEEDFKALFSAADPFQTPTKATAEPEPPLSVPPVTDEMVMEAPPIPDRALTDVLEPEKKKPRVARRKSEFPKLLFLLLILGGIGWAIYTYSNQFFPMIGNLFYSRQVRTKAAPLENFTAKVPALPPTAPPKVEPSPQPSVTTPTALPSTPTPQAVSPTPAPESAAQASLAQQIDWSVDQTTTTISILTNGTLSADRYTHERVEGKNPREVVSLKGIVLPFIKAKLNVSSPQVKQIRTGFHKTETGSELHIVIDLATPNARLIRMYAENQSLKVVLE